MKLRKNDFDKVNQLEMKKEFMKHKEKIESIYRQKLEDEKRKVLQGKMEEFEELIADNKRYKEEIGKLKVALINKQ